MTAEPIARYRLTAVKAKPDGWQTFDPGQTERDRLETALAAALADLASRWVDRAATRIGSPRQRKGTRHWVPEFDNDTRVGTKALDAAHATGEDEAAQDAQDTAEPLIRPATVAAALALYMALSGEEEPPEDSLLAEITAETSTLVLALIAASAARQVGILTDLINSLDQSGAEMPAIRSAVLDHYPVMQEWARGLAVQAATATVEGAREDAASHLADEDESLDVLRRWRTRRDERVRDSHVKAEGQEQEIGTPFTVGGALLRFPGDPRAPFRETANCRCHLVWRSKRTGRFLPKREDDEAKARYGADGLTHAGTVTVRVGGRSYRWKPDDHPRDRHGRFISTGGEVRTAAGDLAKVTNVVDRNHIQVQTSDGHTQTVDRHSVEVTKAPDGKAPKTNVADVGERVPHDRAHAEMPPVDHPSAPDTHHPDARNAPAPDAPVSDRIRHLRQTMPNVPKPIDDRHAADLLRASSDVAHHEQRVRAAQQVHDNTETALAADHPNREQIMSTLRQGVEQAHEGLHGALDAQRRTHSPQHYAADRVYAEWQRLDGSRYDAGIRRASPKQQSYIAGLIREVVHPVNPRAARDMLERPRWHAANAGPTIDVLKGARDHLRAQQTPDAPSPDAPDVPEAPAAPHTLSNADLARELSNVGGALSNHEEALHANREQAGADWRSVTPTDEHRAAQVRHAALMEEQQRREALNPRPSRIFTPNADRTHYEHTGDNGQSATLTKRPDGGWDWTATHSDGTAHSGQAGNVGGAQQAADAALDAHVYDPNAADPTVHPDTAPDAAMSAPRPDAPIKWRRHGRGLVSDDGNYFIERGVRIGTLYRRASEDDYNNALAERLVYDYERDPEYGVDQSTLPPFDYGTVIGNALMGELRLYAEDDKRDRALAQAGDTDGGASTGDVPSTEQDAAGLYDLAGEFEDDGTDFDRVAVSDALRDFADAQTYGNEDDKTRAEATLASTLDTLDENSGDDVAVARLIEQARTATRPVPVTPQSGAPDVDALRDAAIAYNSNSEDWTPEIEAEVRAGQPKAQVLLADPHYRDPGSAPRRVVITRGFDTSEGFVAAGEPEAISVPAGRMRLTGLADDELRRIGRRTGLPFEVYSGQVREDRRRRSAEEADRSQVGDVSNINAGLDALSGHEDADVRNAANAAREQWRNGDDDGAATALEATGNAQAAALAESIRQSPPTVPGAAASDWGRQEGDTREYAGLHQPNLDGPTLDDLLAGGSVPDDFYTHMHFYKYQGGPADDESEAAIRAARGKPDAMVTIYRAAPPGVTSINTGDWITLSQTYAEQHAMQDDNPENDWPVYSAQVPASSIRWDGNDLNEMGYAGAAVAVGQNEPGVGAPGQPQNVLPERFPPGTMTRGMVVNVPPDMAERMAAGEITADDIVTGILDGEAGSWWAPSDVHDPVDAAAYAYSDETVTKAVAEGDHTEYGLGGQAGIILVADHDPAAFVDDDEADRMLMAENVAVRDGQTLRLRSIYYSPDGQQNWHEIDATGHTVNSTGDEGEGVSASDPNEADVAIRDLKVGDRALLPSGTGYMPATVTAIGEDEDEPGHLRVDYTLDNGDLDSLYADPTLIVTKAPAVIDRPTPQPDVPVQRTPATIGEVQVGDRIMIGPPDGLFPVEVTNKVPLVAGNDDAFTIGYRRLDTGDEDITIFGSAVPVVPAPPPAPTGPPPRGRVALRTYQRRMIHSYGFATRHPDAAVRRAHNRLLNYEALSQEEAQALAGALREEAARSLPRRAGALNRAAASFDALDNHLGNMPPGTGQRRSAMDARTGDWVRVNGIVAKVTNITRQQGGKVLTLSLTDESGQQHTIPLMRGTQIEGLDAPEVDPTIEPDPDADDPSADDSKTQRATVAELGKGMYVTIPGSDAVAAALGVDPASLAVTGKVVRVQRTRQGGVRAITVSIEQPDGSIRADHYVPERAAFIHPAMPEPTPVVDDKPDRTVGERSIGHADVAVGDRIRIANSGTGQEFVGTVTQVNPTTGYDEDTLSEVPGTEISLREDGSTTAYTHVLFGDDRAVLLSKAESGDAERMQREQEEAAARQTAEYLGRTVSQMLASQRDGLMTRVQLAQGQGRDYVLDVVLGPDARYQSTGANQYGYYINSMNRELMPNDLDPETRRALLSSVADRNTAIITEALGRNFDAVRQAFQDATPLPGEDESSMIGRVIGQFALDPQGTNADYTDAFMNLARIREHLASSQSTGFTYVPSDDERAAAEQRARNALTNARREAIEKFKAHLLDEKRVSEAIYGGAIQRLANKYDGVEMAKLLQRPEFAPHPRWSSAVMAAQAYGQDAGRTASIRSAATGAVNSTVRDAMVDVLREMKAGSRDASPTYTEKLGDMLDRIAAEPDSRAQDIINERAQNIARDGADHLAAGGDPIDDNGDALPEPGGAWTERVAAWRAVLPDDPDKFGQRQMKVKALGEFTLADLEAGKTPEIVDAVEYVPDRASDGGPGDTAMRHLHAMRQVGDAINEEYASRLAAAFPEMGDDPEAYLADLSDRAKAAMEEMTNLDREMREVRQQIEAEFVGEAFRDAPHDMEIRGARNWDTIRYRMSALRMSWGNADRTEEQRRREVAEYERLSALDDRRMQAFRDNAAEGGKGHELSRRRNEASDQWRTLRNLHTSERQRIGEVKAKIARDVLAELRPMGTPPGGGLKYRQGERSQGVKALRWAEQWYPSDWLTAERQQQMGDFTVKSTQRGYYNRQMTTISISGSSVEEKNQVAVHELGHHMERVVPGLVAAEDAFLWSRTSTGPVGARQREALTRIYSGPKEVGRKDKFKSHYTGKDYGRGDAHEVFTTGIESLFAGSDYLDDDMRNFMFGALATLGGPPRTDGGPSRGTGGTRARRTAGQYGEARVAGELGGTFAAGAPAGTARVRVTPSTYQGTDGHVVSGTDTRGRRVNVFVPGEREAADRAAGNVRAGRGAFADEAPAGAPAADRPMPSWDHDQGSDTYSFTTADGRTFTVTRAATGWRLTDSEGEPMMATSMSRAKAEAHRRYYGR